MVSLKLLKNNIVIFSSDKNWLTPLYEAITKFGEESNLFLFDKVVGLAAAKLIVHSKIINEVSTPIISKDAKKYLEINNIKISYDSIVDAITKKDGSLCEMDQLAKTTAPEELYDEIQRRIQTNIKNKK